MRAISYIEYIARGTAALMAQALFVPALSEPAAFLRHDAPRVYARRTSRYMPHQGERECARRRRQIAAGQIST